MRTTQEPMADDDFGAISKLSRDFAELQAEKSDEVDRAVNRWFIVFCAGIIGFVLGAALGYW
jgi:uncharacterized membrane protein YoaK (UPF0700 family)